MRPDSSNSRTLLLWGAGATAELGMRTTLQQSNFLRELAGDGSKDSRNGLDVRATRAIGDNGHSSAHSALAELLLILGDGNEIGGEYQITTKQQSAMRRNWDPRADEDTLQNRILELRRRYDWIALKSIINTFFPAIDRDEPDQNCLTDLFNVLDMHSQSGHGFRVQEKVFLEPTRLDGARNALKMLLVTMFFIDWHALCNSKGKRRHLQHYRKFAEVLGKRMQRRGVLLADQYRFEDPGFYMDDLSFASLNYDPIFLWLKFLAYRDLNKNDAPHVANKSCRLLMYHDMGHFVPSVRIGTGSPEYRRLAMTESAAQRLNDPEYRADSRIRMSKFLYLHGCLNWRECPNCGKLTAFMSDEWEACSPTLFPFPPLKAFTEDISPNFRIDEERMEFDRGAVDVRACVHCDTLTYLHHARVIMQSNFKTPPPPFVEEIQRDFRVVVQDAGHIVFMGYSLPRDDVDYRAFFAARRQRASSGNEEGVKCSVVVGSNAGFRHWMMPEDLRGLKCLEAHGLSPGSKETLEAARHLFGKENVRFYGGGIPEAFMDGGGVSDAAVDRLLDWESTR